MEMKSFYPKGNWVKRKSRIKESVESLIKWVFEKTVRKSWQSRWATNPYLRNSEKTLETKGFSVTRKYIFQLGGIAPFKGYAVFSCLSSV